MCTFLKLNTQKPHIKSLLPLSCWSTDELLTCQFPCSETCNIIINNLPSSLCYLTVLNGHFKYCKPSHVLSFYHGRSATLKLWLNNPNILKSLQRGKTVDVSMFIHMHLVCSIQQITPSWAVYVNEMLNTYLYDVKLQILQVSMSQ